MQYIDLDLNTHTSQSNNEYQQQQKAPHWTAQTERHESRLISLTSGGLGDGQAPTVWFQTNRREIELDMIGNRVFVTVDLEPRSRSRHYSILLESSTRLSRSIACRSMYASVLSNRTQMFRHNNSLLNHRPAAVQMIHSPLVQWSLARLTKTSECLHSAATPPIFFFLSFWCNISILLLHN